MNLGNGFDELINEIADEVYPEKTKEKVRINRHGKPDKRGRQRGTKIVDGKVVIPDKERKVRVIKKEEIKEMKNKSKEDKSNNIEKLIEILENVTCEELSEEIELLQREIEKLDKKRKKLIAFYNAKETIK